jgi:hypothetical protein
MRCVTGFILRSTGIEVALMVVVMVVVVVVVIELGSRNA